jgi:succinate dehydrogenase / fumarate reductase flavoprotein subunit
MQGLADGYFIIPYTLGNYLAQVNLRKADTEDDAFSEAENDAASRINKLLSIKGNRTVTDYHRELGSIMWDEVGMSRNASGLQTAVNKISALREDFWQNVNVPGERNYYNKYLEFTCRVADFLELGELMARDALNRKESCGGHFREEAQTAEGEAVRNDEDYAYVAAWEYRGPNVEPEMHKEHLEFENVELTTRSYK